MEAVFQIGHGRRRPPVLGQSAGRVRAVLTPPGRSWPLPKAKAPRGAKETPPEAGMQGSTEGLRWQTTHSTCSQSPPDPCAQPPTGTLMPPHCLSCLTSPTAERQCWPPRAGSSRRPTGQDVHRSSAPEGGQTRGPRRQTSLRTRVLPEGTPCLPPKRQEDHREDGFLPEALLLGGPGVDTAGARPAPPTLPDSHCSLQGLPPWNDRTHPGAPHWFIAEEKMVEKARGTWALQRHPLCSQLLFWERVNLSPGWRRSS